MNEGRDEGRKRVREMKTKDVTKNRWTSAGHLMRGTDNKRWATKVSSKAKGHENKTFARAGWSTRTPRREPGGKQ